MKRLHSRNCFSSQRQRGFDGPGRINSQAKFLLQTKNSWLSHSFIFNELQHSLWSKAGSLTQEEKWFLRWIYCKPCLISKHLEFFSHMLSKGSNVGPCGIFSVRGSNDSSLSWEFSQKRRIGATQEVFSLAGNYKYLNKVSDLDVSKDNG